MKHNMFSRLLVALLLLCLLAGCGPAFPATDLSGRPDSVESSAPDAAGLTVHFIDVGQGDCILIQCDGANLLIDAGVESMGETVADYLEVQGVTELTYAVGTHPHEDHIGGLDVVLDRVRAETLLMPDVFTDSMCYQQVLEAAARQDLTPTEPELFREYPLGGGSFVVYGPEKEYSDKNNCSIVLKLTYGETSFLFTGDMETEEAGDIVESGADLSADVMKVGHHGSSNSTPYRFLREVMPAYSVIQCAAGNDYGHPHEELLSRLEDSGTAILRTDLNGTVVIRSNGSELTVTVEKGEVPVPAEPEPELFIGNVNSKKLHTADCGSLPKEENRVYFDSWDQAVAAGYEPHAACCGG